MQKRVRDRVRYKLIRINALAAAVAIAFGVWHYITFASMSSAAEAMPGMLVFTFIHSYYQISCPVATG